MRKPYALNRKTYKDIKKMDHAQMSRFCENLYKNGYVDGKEEAEGLSEEEVKQALLQVKGIGEKKAADIMEALNCAQKEKGSH